MPRKARPGLPELHIEQLSTGKIYGLRDEFTRELIPQPNARPRKTGHEYERERVERKRLAQLSVLVDAGLGAKVGYARKREQIELVPKGKRKIGEVNGQAILIDAPPKPAWRRS